MSYSKDDVEFHTSGYSGPRYPAVNVKDYGNGGYRAVSTLTDRGVSQDVAERAIDTAMDFHRETFWSEDANRIFEEVYGYKGKIYSGGRSGGWLIVTDLMDFEYWDAVMLGKWRKFEGLIKGECKWLMGEEMLLETVMANDLTNDGANES